MPKTGENPGNGTYKCDQCGETVTVSNTTEQLPPCPKCSGASFSKAN